MKPLTFSFAQSQADIQGAMAVRLEVFVREQQVPPEEELDEVDATARHLVVKDGGRVVATARLFYPAPGQARIGRMAVLASHRRRGLGRRMLEELCREAKAHGAASAVLNAQWQARPFYAACGFSQYGEVFYEAGIKHIAMTRPL